MIFTPKTEDSLGFILKNPIQSAEKEPSNNYPKKIDKNCMRPDISNMVA